MKLFAAILPATKYTETPIGFVGYPTYPCFVSPQPLEPQPHGHVRSRGKSMPLEILIADDSDAVRKAVRNYLTERNFNVCGEAIDGQDAIEKTRELKPDLILLDLAMPRANGI